MLDAAWAEGTAVAVGERGGIWTSEGGVAPWRRVPPLVNNGLNAVYFLGRSGWAVGNDGVILRTQDGGRHWAVARAPERGRMPLFDVGFRTPLVGVAVGASGACLRTVDGGRTWEPFAPPSGDRHLYAVLALKDRWMVAGESGTMLLSEDGLRWRAVPAGTRSTLYGVVPLGGDELLAFGFRGALARGRDGGRRWEKSPSFSDESLAGGAALAGGGIVLADAQGELWASRDGKTFGRTAGGGSLSAVLPLPDGRVAAAGEGGIKILTPVLP